MTKVTNAQLNNPYKFSVYCSTSPSLANNSAQKVTMDTKLFDTNNNFDSTTNYRYAAPVAGFYYFSTKVVIGVAGIASTAFGNIYLFKNGSEVVRGQQLSGSGTATTIVAPQISEFIQLAAGDFIEVWAICSEAGRSIQGGNNYTYLRGFLVSSI